ncbi:MAG: hypothetical protein MUF48_16430 [Pirellulaceae bacterium]|jgi:hypothetical protein|nr:hypothetical protein [Pirellulaceae bacterium]
MHRAAGKLYAVGLGFCVVGLLAGGRAAAGENAPDSDNQLSFTAAKEGAFTFDTGTMRGQLRGNGRAFGISAATHIASGQSLSGSLGLLAVYRVFSDGQRYGDAGWDWPSQAGVNPDGTVTVACAAEPARPFACTGLYRWVSPTTLDLELTVAPERDLHGFEIFLASYFDSAFASAAAYVAEQPERQGQPGFLSAREALGNWLMFPRDEQAVTLIQDGRWTLPPHPVQWVIVPRLARPLALRRVPASGLTVLLMTRPEDGFAVAMPYETEQHYSVYLSLFGRDLPAGQPAQARVRLQVLDAPSEPDMLAAYEQFLR